MIAKRNFISTKYTRPVSYTHLDVYKRQQYALEHYDFDWLFKCDDDTWLALDRLESLCDGRYDLVGDMSLADRGLSLIHI